MNDLVALGYIDHVESEDRPDAAPLPLGVFLHDREASWPGYNLYSSLPAGISQLIDAEGQVIQTWHQEGSRTVRCELLPDGDVLVIGVEGSAKAPRHHLSRFDWSGDLVWRRDMEAHHDVELTPSGQILVLTRAPRTTADGELRFTDNSLTLLSGAGQELRSVSIYDAVRAGGDLMPLAIREDPLHANSVHWMRNRAHARRDPIYALGNVLVSLRYQDSLAIVNTAEQRTIWTWGRGEVVQQHDAHVLDNGNILLFDNGDPVRRPWSRIVELDPLRREIVWQYRAPEPEDFFSAARGTVQGLPNGNVLIGHPAMGEAFEVTREGRIVWHFRSPIEDSQGHRGVIRIERYPIEMVERILAERGER